RPGERPHPPPPAGPAGCRGQRCRRPPWCRRSGPPPGGRARLGPDRTPWHIPPAGRSVASRPAAPPGRRWTHFRRGSAGPRHRMRRRLCRSLLPHLIQIRPPGGEDGQLGPYRLQPFHVQVRVQGCLLRPGPAEHGAPGIHGDGVAVGHVGALFVPGGGDPHGEALVVHCPLAEEKFPVGGAGSHVEGRRHEDHLCPPQAHAPGQLLEPQVEADAQPHGAEGRLEGGDGISRGEGVRLPEPL
ncbi:Stage 0 sporulation A-like protein, partial [Dysosmobacter welbionis]